MAQRRESARLTAIGEVVKSAEGQQEIRVVKTLRGKLSAEHTESLELTATGKFKPGTLVIAFVESEEAGKLQGTVVAASELGMAYFVRSPDMRQPGKTRLPYFIKYLEHADPLAAEDAFLEFGHAPLEDVLQVAADLPQEKLRGWLVDRKISGARQGFYGLALGLATDKDDRKKNAELLHAQIVAKTDDFRAGFDGILAGYVMLAGDDAVKLLDQRYFANPRAADGDVRHAINAARFCHEYAKNVSPESFSVLLRHLLSRHEFAATAIVDLARWKDWDALDAVVKLYDTSSKRDAAINSINRSVVGYLSACPETRAAKALAELRKLDSPGVAAAEKELAAFPAAN